ncbi:MAG TPA: glycosyltransferase family 39 protein [Pseudonocardia sp.]
MTPRPEHARRGLPSASWLVAALVSTVLLLVAVRYGFHGDEFYFVVTGRHLQAAAPDNPMLVPYLAAGWYWLVGGQLWAFRILPALAAGGFVLLGALTAREFGASARHQVAAAVAVAMTALVLAVGHLFETTTFDMVFTASAIWLLVRALRARPDRWAPWIGAGVFAGLAMEVKVLAAAVLACCLLGVLITGPRDRLVGPRPGVAVLIALVLASPNLVWQATHGFPMAGVAATISGGGSTSSTPRLLLVPITLLDIGPVVSIVFVVGLVGLLRRARRGVDGWVAVGFLLFFGLLLIAGGKAYYPAAFVPAVLAAGAGSTLEWIVTRPWRRVLAVALGVVSIVVTPSLTLPIWPAGSALYTVATGPNPDLAEELGWPGYVETIDQVAAGLPPAEWDHTVIVTTTYKLAAALDVLGPATGRPLPAVYSTHLGYWYWGPPPDSVIDALVVGDVSTVRLGQMFGECSVLATVTSPPGVDNDETGIPIRHCSRQRLPWSSVWPLLAPA